MYWLSLVEPDDPNEMGIYWPGVVDNIRVCGLKGLSEPEYVQDYMREGL